jgi:hypothetical protein
LDCRNRIEETVGTVWYRRAVAAVGTMGYAGHCGRKHCHTQQRAYRSYALCVVDTLSWIRAICTCNRSRARCTLQPYPCNYAHMQPMPHATR